MPTEVSAKLVMQLRAATGLPMMKCKEALEANGGNFEAAVDWLRKKGLETAAKKADRAMKEGRVAILAAADGSSVSMVEIDCETEPVTQNAEFRAMVDGVCAMVEAGGGGAPTAAGEIPLDGLLAKPYGGKGETVETTVKTLVAKVGENMSLRRAAKLSGSGRVGKYLHFNHRVGVLAELSGDAKATRSDEATLFVDLLCKHIAFGKPVAVSRAEVSKETAEKELEIYREQAKQDPKMAGKPAPVVEKIVLGKLDKYFAEKCLLEQAWIHDDKESVGEALKSAAARAGGALAIQRFVLFQVGA